MYKLYFKHFGIGRGNIIGEKVVLLFSLPHRHVNIPNFSAAIQDVILWPPNYVFTGKSVLQV